MDFGAGTSGSEAHLCHLIFLFILSRMLLFYINFGDRSPPYPALGYNIPSARRPGQWFNFLQCRGSSQSLRFVNRHGATLRRAGWVAFIIVPAFPCVPVFEVPRPRPTHPRVPNLMSLSPSSRVPKSQDPTQVSPHRCPHVPISLLYTALDFLQLPVVNKALKWLQSF